MGSRRRLLTAAAAVTLCGAAAGPAPAVTGADPLIVFAGTNTNNAASTAGDGGPATAAVLFRPRAAAATPTGEVVIVQRGEPGVRAVGRDSVIRRIGGTYVSGDGGDGPALSTPVTGLSGVAVDPSGNVFVADENSSKVRRIDRNGNMATVLSGLNGPLGMAADGAGNVLVAVAGAARVIRLSPAGVSTTVAGTGTAGFNGDGIAATSAQLAGPGGVAVDPAGNVVIADGARVRRVAAATGLISTIAGTGTAGFSGDGGPATAAQVSATGVAVDRAGNVYIAEGAAGHRIRRVGTDGIITTIAGNGTPGFGGNGGPASGAVLNTPFGISVDATGSLLIGDEGSSTVRRIINVPPVASLGATPTSGLTPLTVTVDGSASSGVNDGIVAHSWDFGDGATATGATATHTYAAAGTFTIRLTVMDASGATATATRTVSTATPALRLTDARFAPRWRASRPRGRLVLTGSADRATTVAVRILRVGGRGRPLLARSFRLARAGAFTRAVALGGRLLPGPLLVRVADAGAGAKLTPDERRATLPAPREGVASRAAISTAVGGRPRPRIVRGPGIVFAGFRFASLPRKGRALTVTWYAGGTRISTVPKPRTRVVTAFLRSRAGALRPGAYRAELRWGRTLVAVARTRIV